MKDIKELIYAAVEENALKFQELVNAQLQVRAYEAIESLRPEIGASMFGESSHKKMDDEEDMEDEDEDEMDDKKKSMKEAKLDPVGREDSDIDNDGDTDKSDKYLHNRRKKIGQAIKEMSDDERRKEFDRFGKKAAETHGYDYPGDTSKASSSAVKSELKAARKVFAGTAKPYRSPKVNEEVEPSTSRFQVHVDRKDPGNVEKAHHATSGAGNKHFRGTGLARMDKPGGPHDPTGEHHVIHAPDHVSHATLKKNISEYGAKATIVDTHTGNRETVHPYNAVREEVVADKVRTKGSVKFFSKKKLPGSDKSSMNEVAMPKNAADWQALINHQIKVADHPVATKAQFSAQNSKDMSKIASLEPGQDALQYATAQGGTVKLP